MSPPQRSATSAASGRSAMPLGRSATISAVTTTITVTPSSRMDRRISRDDMFLRSEKPRLFASSRRISRDDLYLMRPSTAGNGAGARFPPRIDSVRALPEDGSFAGFCTSSRHDRSESTTSGEIQIGMALGSPAHPPAFLRAQPLSPERPSWTMSSRVPLPHDTTPVLSPAASVTSPVSIVAPPIAPAAASVAAPVLAPVMTPVVAPAMAPAVAPAPTTAVSIASSAPAGGSLQRAKTTRRKLFGIFGSRRHQEPTVSPSAPHVPQESKSAVVSPTASVTGSVASATAPEQPRPSAMSRSGTKKYRPLVVPTMEPDLALSTSTQTSTPPSAAKDARARPYLRSKASEPAIRQRAMVGSATAAASDNSQPPVPPIAASPYLNIDIPDVRLERYSVMFGSLLATPPTHAQNSAAWQPASSLLARRQATLDQLKMINEGMMPGVSERDTDNVTALCPPPSLHRSATTPQPAKSPGLSLFPGRSPGVEASLSAVASPVGIALPSPRLRSNTAPIPRSPVASVTPVYSPAPTQQLPRLMNPLRGNPTTFTMPKRAATVTAATSSASPHTLYFNPSPSSLVLESPSGKDYSTADEDSQFSPHMVAQPLKSGIAEPQWQGVSKVLSTKSPSSAGSGSSSSSNALSNTITGSSTQSAGSTTVESDQDKLDRDNELSSAVELSIARQISISRQQRQMLRPLRTGRSAATVAEAVEESQENAISPSLSGPVRTGTLRLGRNERLVETRAATPTMVLADRTMTTGSSGQPGQQSQQQRTQQQHPLQRMYVHASRHNANAAVNPIQVAQNRKSERVVLEAA